VEKTFVAEASTGTVRTFEISPEDFGIERTPLDGLGGGDADANAKIIRDVLAGNRRDAARSLVLVYAAAALHVGGIAADVKEGMKLAEESIDSGAAGEKLTNLIRFTTRDVA
jgi:anthranilate phosphoribosyltransferase